MSVEFIDTNILIYAHDTSAGAKHRRSIELLTRLFEGLSGALSVQVLSEFYSAATTKLDIHPEDIVVRYASPDVAVVMDKTVVKGTRQGKDITGTYRVLRVFVKQQGKWRAAGAGLTRIAAEQSSTQ